MNGLVKKLMDQGNLDEKAAEKVIGLVKEFLSDKLPEAIEGPVMKALDGLDLEDADDAMGKVKGLFK